MPAKRKTERQMQIEAISRFLNIEQWKELGLIPSTPQDNDEQTSVPELGTQIPESGTSVPISGLAVLKSGTKAPTSGAQVPKSSTHVPKTGNPALTVPKAGTQVPKPGVQVPKPSTKVPQTGTTQTVPKSGTQVPDTSTSVLAETIAVQPVSMDAWPLEDRVIFELRKRGVPYRTLWWLRTMVGMYGLRFVTTTSNIASMFDLTKGNVHDDMNQLRKAGVTVTSTRSFTIIDLTPLTNTPVENFHGPDTHSPDDGTDVPKTSTSVLESGTDVLNSSTPNNNVVVVEENPFTTTTTTINNSVPDSGTHVLKTGALSTVTVEQTEVDETTAVEFALAIDKLELSKHVSPFVISRLIRLFYKNKLAALTVLSYSKNKCRSNLGGYLAQILLQGPHLDRIEQMYRDLGQQLLNEITELANFVCISDPTVWAVKYGIQRAMSVLKRLITDEYDLINISREEHAKLRRRLIPVLKLIEEQCRIRTARRRWWCESIA